MAKQSRTDLATRQNGIQTESKPKSLLAEYSALRYDYSRIANSHRRAVQDAAVDIRRKQRRVIEDLLAIGRRLIEVKDFLPHGEFGNWIESEFELSERVVQGMMNAARVYSDEAKARRVALLSERAIYFLAAPSTPQTARDEVEQLLESGHTLTSSEVEQIIREHRNGIASPSEPGTILIEMQAETPAVVVESDHATVADLVRLVAQEIVEVAGKDIDSQIYALDGMARGDRNATLDRVAGWIRREGGAGDFRQEDLVVAIKSVAEQKRTVKADRAAKKGPPPPTTYDLRLPVKTWLSAQAEGAKAQHALALKLASDAHPFLYADLGATLPAAWRKRDLAMALAYVAENLRSEFGEDEWEIRRLPSGRVYAQNMARYAKATLPFATEAEALAATAEAQASERMRYEGLEKVLNDPQAWNADGIIREADAEWLQEIRWGLEARASLPDAPAFVTDRLKRVHQRVEEAQRLVKWATEPKVLEPTMPADLVALGYELVAAESMWRWELWRFGGHWQGADLGSPEAAIADAQQDWPMRQQNRTFVLSDPLMDAAAPEPTHIEADYIVFESEQPKPHTPTVAEWAAHVSFGAWLAMMPPVEHWAEEGSPSLRECLALLALAKTAAQRARTLEPSLNLYVSNALPTLSQLIIATEKQVKA